MTKNHSLKTRARAWAARTGVSYAQALAQVTAGADRTTTPHTTAAPAAAGWFPRAVFDLGVDVARSLDRAPVMSIVGPTCSGRSTIARGMTAAALKQGWTVAVLVRDGLGFEYEGPGADRGLVWAGEESWVEGVEWIRAEALARPGRTLLVVDEPFLHRLTGDARDALLGVLREARSLSLRVVVVEHSPQAGGALDEFEGLDPVVLHLAPGRWRGPLGRAVREQVPVEDVPVLPAERGSWVLRDDSGRWVTAQSTTAPPAAARVGA